MYLALITLPLLGSIASGLFGRKLGVTGSQLITSSLVIITTFLAILAYLEVGLNSIPVSIQLFKWIDSESLIVYWGFNFDSLTVYFVGISLNLWEVGAVLVWIQLYKLIFIQNLKVVNPLGQGLLTEGPVANKKKGRFFLNSSRIKTSLCPSHNSAGLVYSGRGSTAYKTISSSIQIRKYSSLPLKDVNLNGTTLSSTLDSYFLQWFVGFTDAEGNFSIIRNPGKNKEIASSFSFMFKISLHKDDEMVLRYINDKLGVGGVRLYKDECIFSVIDRKGVASLIDIFDKYNLNTTKYLDYLDFKEAFLFFINRSKDLNPELVNSKVLSLKNKMNTNRIYFERPMGSEINITKSWLLGFIEGDGSFFLRRDNIVPTFSIELTGVQLPVMLKIKEFLENSLGFDPYSLYKLKNSSIIAINTAKARNNGKSSVSLTIKNINVLNNYFIPFFETSKFLTKKGKDFNDFKIISKAVFIGAHRNEGIRSLILKLANTMNNFRLSTYKGIVQVLSLEEINQITTALPTIEYLLDGRVIDKHTKKLLPRLVTSVYEIHDADGSIILANSLTEAASIVGLYPDTLSKHLDVEVSSSEGMFVDIKDKKIRRVRVFIPI
jgi:LAGLIDADG DNA endonuclease family protein